MTRENSRLGRIGVVLAAALALAPAVLGIIPVGAALAAEGELVIGLGGAVSSIDPHYHNVSTNIMVALHIFEPLIQQDAQQKLVPGLATAWRAIDARTWEFDLRPGVKFQDGSEFGPEDVAATIRRAPNVANSPSSFRLYVGNIERLEVVDAHRIRLHTKEPAPLLPNDISNVVIINRKFAEAGTADFNSGAAAIGTGPYRLAHYTPGDRVDLVRHDGYWGPKPDWAKVSLRLMTNAAGRVAALRAGDVQAIDNVPTPDVARLKEAPDLTVVGAPSNRLIYLAMDHMKDQTVFIRDNADQPLPTNPLKDLRVRQALSLAIDRPRITDRVMEGQAIPAGQFLPEGFFGTSGALPVLKPDIARARELLAQAGYPLGFHLTLHGPNDRYVNDEKVLQVIAQMFIRIGVATRVETMPWASFASRAAKQEFSVFLVGWSAQTGETSSPLRSLVASFNTEKSLGASNRGHYSNPAVDAAIDQAMNTIRDADREALLRTACELAIRDVGIIPLHYEVTVWGLRKGLSYEGRADQYTLAMGIRPAAR